MTAGGAAAPTTVPRPARALRRRRKLLFVAVLGLASLLLLLALGELAARWNVEGGFWPAIDSIVRLRRAEAPGSRQMLIEDPDLGFRINPGYEGVNSFGIRGAEIEQPKPKGTWRLLVLGDSISFPEEGWVRGLASTLATAHGERLAVINASCHGYTTYQERLHLERDLLVLEPDLVLVQYCVNDNWHFLHRLTSTGRRLMTPEAKAYLFPEGNGFLGWLYRTSYLAYGVRQWLYGLGQRPRSDLPWHDDRAVAAAWRDETWPEQEQHFAAMAASARAVGGKLAVLAVPWEPQIDPALLARDAALARKPQRLLGAICARLGVPFLDLHESFVAARERRLYSDGLHLTATGHAIVAAQVAEWLGAEKLLPAR